jgi:hypothetical protein
MMKKILLVFLAASALGYSAVVQAQTSAPPPGAAQIPAGPELSLEGRYLQCISEALCPLQTRLQIVQEEMIDMNIHFQKVFEACAATNFQGCVDSQRVEMDMWHSADYRAAQMMLSIEAQSLALKESAAGGPDQTAENQKGKSFWDRFWGR